MSEVKRYDWSEDGMYPPEDGRYAGYYVLASDYDASQSELAALREELATAKRANYNAEVALKAAYETQELWKGRTTNLTHTNADLQQRLTAAEQRNAELTAALKFYADRDHYSTDDGENWDSCSGEPSNILWHEEQPWFIEDGSVARAALANPTESGASE